jgi:hypothetical protein
MEGNAWRVYGIQILPWNQSLIFILKFVFEGFFGRLGYIVADRQIEVFIYHYFGESWWDTLLYVEMSG